MNSHLVHRRPSIIRKVDDESNKTESDTMREVARRNVAQREAFTKWLADKANKVKAAVVDVDLLARLEAERLAEMERRREGAYVAWIERKQAEHEKALAARGVITMSHKGFELADVRRVYDRVNLGDDAFKLVDKFMRDVAESQNGFIDPQHVQEVLTQVSTQRQVDERVQVLKKQEKNDARTKEEKEAERVKLKIGQQMLDLLSSGKNGRTLFGVVITSGTPWAGRAQHCRHLAAGSAWDVSKTAPGPSYHLRLAAARTTLTCLIRLPPFFLGC